jgi:hypothetical protein
MMMNRRAFSAALVTGAAASLISTRGMATNSTPAKASNVVLVHGLREAGRNRRQHCGRSGQIVRRAPTPRASGHPVRLPRGGTEPPALSCCVDQARGGPGCLIDLG